LVTRRYSEKLWGYFKKKKLEVLRKGGSWGSARYSREFQIKSK